MIAGLCSEPFVLEIMRIVNTVISLLRIIVPLILIIIIMIKVGKGITEGEEELNKAIKGSISKFIAAILIFFVPTIVVTIFNLTLPNSEFLDCLTVKTKEEISQIYLKRETELVAKAEETMEEEDYDAAYGYLNHIKDDKEKENFRNRLNAVWEQIDNTRKALQIYGENTGYGSDVAITEHIKVACKWVLHPDDIKIRLYECTDPVHQHQSPDAALPGGAIAVTIQGKPTYKAKKTITFREYQFGLFAGEIDERWSPTFNRMFAILYRNEILASKVWRIVNNPSLGESEEQQYYNGSCTQNYRQNLLDERYYSGKYADIIDAAVKSTQYIILINKDTGQVTDSMYNTKSGIVQVMDKASKTSDIEGILEAMKSGHTLAYRYKTATLYDCRNVLTEDDIAIEAARNGLEYHRK